MNKKLTYAGVAALLLLVISGCGDKPAAAPADEAGQNSLQSLAEPKEITEMETARVTATAMQEGSTHPPLPSRSAPMLLLQRTSLLKLTNKARAFPRTTRIRSRWSL